MTITRNFKLCLNAGTQNAPYINVNQYDEGEEWVFDLYTEGGQKFTPSTGAIIGIKSDGNAILNSGTVNSDGQVVITETQQMTAASGLAVFELLIEGETHGTANFIVNVERRPSDDAEFSDSDLSMLQEAIDSAAEIEDLLGGQDVPTVITPIISDWLDENITNPSNPPIDTSLTVAGAAADAKKTGDEITDLKSALRNSFPTTDLSAIGGNELTRVSTVSNSIVDRKEGKYIQTNESVSGLSSATQNYGFYINVGEITDDLYIKIRQKNKWSNGDNVVNPYGGKPFVATYFNYSSGVTLENDTEYNLKEIIATVGENAKLYFAFGIRTSEPSTQAHITNTGGTYTIDGTTVEVEVLLYTPFYKENIDTSDLEDSIGDLEDRINDIAVVPIGDVGTAVSNNTAIKSTAGSETTVLLYQGTDTATSAYQWCYVGIKKADDYAGKQYYWKQAFLKWDGESEATDVTNKINSFANTGFSFTGAITLNKNTLYDLDTVFSNFANNATAFIGLGLSPSFDANHIYKVGDLWHIDPFELTIISGTFEKASLVGNSIIAKQLSNGLSGEAIAEQFADVGDRIDAIEEVLPVSSKYITCWGDSLTAMGGWTTELENLSGLTLHNCGIGGERMQEIIARQGADAMIIQDVTIPADTTEVLLATRAQGFNTQMGETVKPLLQGGSAAFNPCKVGEIEGTLRWTGSNYADQSGTWVFARSTVGEAVTLDRPVAITGKADREWNDPYLMVVFMIENNVGFNNNNEITTTISQDMIEKDIKFTNWMINHANAENVIVLGLATGTATSNALYEQMMKAEYGRYFISIREYLVHPVYSNGEIVTCYGLQDLGLTPTENDLTDISNGKVPTECFMDGVHFLPALRPFIGQYIYKCCQELNIF